MTEGKSVMDQLKLASTEPKAAIELKASIDPVQALSLDPIPTEPTLLARLHPHPYDQEILYDAKEHKYQIVGIDRVITSGTAIVKGAFPLFIPDRVIDGIFASRGYVPGHKYWNMTREQIKAEWQLAAIRGTELHAAIEKFYNGISVTLQDPTIIQFQRFHEERIVPLGWVPYRTEWRIRSKKYLTAGTLDITFAVDRSDPRRQRIIDWKRSVIKKDGFRGSNDTNWMHYCVQLNIYRLILVEEYGLIIEGMHIVAMHPEYSQYQFLDVPVMEVEARKVLSAVGRGSHCIPSLFIAGS